MGRGQEEEGSRLHKEAAIEEDSSKEGLLTWLQAQEWAGAGFLGGEGVRLGLLQLAPLHNRPPKKTPGADYVYMNRSLDPRVWRKRRRSMLPVKMVARG